jgi:hypothetical protein
MAEPGIVTHFALDAESNEVFPFQFFDDGSGNVIDDVPVSNCTSVELNEEVAPGRLFVICCTTPGAACGRRRDDLPGVCRAHDPALPGR